MRSIYVLLLGAAMVLVQCMVGGTRLIYSLPAYGILAVASVLTFGSIRKSAVSSDRACLFGVAACFGYIAIRGACSPIEHLAKSDLFSVFGCLIVYLLTSLYLTKTKQRLIIIGLLLALAGTEVAVGLIQFCKDPNFMTFGFNRGASGYWASGMFISHNHFAGYLEMIGVLAVSIALWSKAKPWVRILVGYWAIVCYVGVAIAGSRGGYLSAACSLGVFALLSACVSHMTGRDKAFIGVGLTVVILVIVGALAVPVMSQSSRLREKLQKLTAADIRTPLWEAAWDQFYVSPLIGTGAGTHLYYGRFFRRPEVESDPVHVHNDYLELLAEYGVLGAVGMLAFVLTHVFRGWSSIKEMSRGLIGMYEHGNTDMALQIGALSSLAAVLAHSVVDFNMHIPGNALVCAFLFGIIANPGSDNGVLQAPTPKPLQWLRFVIPVLGAAFLGAGALQTFKAWRAGLSISTSDTWTIAMALPHFPGEYYAEKARVALRDTDLVKCVELAERGLKYDPRNPNLYFYLGEANRGLALKMKRPGFRNIQFACFEKAAEAYRAGLKLFPQDVQQLLRLGQSLDGMRKFEEATPVYLEAIKNDPNLSMVHIFYGAHLEKAGRKVEAEIAFRRAAELEHHDIRPLMRELRAP